MREFRTYGSVRGVLGNRHPYRDRYGGSLRSGEGRAYGCSVDSRGCPTFTINGKIRRFGGVYL
jgi:hypothetical protein